MFKNLISHRNEDACIYLQCSNSNKIICNFYYKEDANCDEIIGLLYFGPTLYAKYKNTGIVNFSINSFLDYTKELRNCYYIEGDYNIIIKSADDILNIYKKGLDYTNIRLTKKDKLFNKNIWLWEISIRQTELAVYLEELEKIKQVIMEAHTNVKTNN